MTNDTKQLRFAQLTALVLSLLGCHESSINEGKHANASIGRRSSAAPVQNSDRLFSMVNDPDCVKHAEDRNVASDVTQDLAQGENRFYSLTALEGPAYAPAGAINCVIYAKSRPRFFAGVVPLTLRGSALRNACTIAIVNYLEDYNKELARKEPRSAAAQCRGDQPIFYSGKRDSPEEYLARAAKLGIK